MISLAKGETKRFDSLLSEYKNNKDLTKYRLYLDTLKKVLGEKSKTVITNKVLPHIPLNNKVFDVPITNTPNVK